MNTIRGTYSVSRMKAVWAEIRTYMVKEKLTYLKLSTVEMRIPTLDQQRLSTNDKMVICSIVQRENEFEMVEDDCGTKILHYFGGNRYE